MVQRLLLVIGATLFLTGVVLGFLPVSSGDTACGSAFVDSSDTAEFGDTLNGGTGRLGCPGARSEARALPVALLLIGAGLAGGSVVVRPRERAGVRAAA